MNFKIYISLQAFMLLIQPISCWAINSQLHTKFSNAIASVCVMLIDNKPTRTSLSQETIKDNSASYGCNFHVYSKVHCYQQNALCACTPESSVVSSYNMSLWMLLKHHNQRMSIDADNWSFFLRNMQFHTLLFFIINVNYDFTAAMQ